jgi:hypothetical protein
MTWTLVGVWTLAVSSSALWGAHQLNGLITEESCLKCHAADGYRKGEVRGGISTSVPLAPYLALVRDRTGNVAAVHFALWALGTSGILLAGLQLRKRIDLQSASEVERDLLVQELQGALASVKSLSGLLPICANCKKIRDDTGYWSQVESYVMSHSDARFTHGICPECIARYHPDSC